MPVSSWSPTAGSNTGILPGLTLDGSVMTPPQIDDAFRNFAAQIAAQLGKLGFKGADMASASTVNLATATGWYLDITGTTTITAFGTVDAGLPFLLRFTGALLLTHNATSLILPGGASFTTAAGDVAMMMSLGSGNWKCLFYQKAAGLGVIGPVSTTDNTVPRFNGTAGNLQDSDVIIDDSNNVSGIGALTASGTATADRFASTASAAVFGGDSSKAIHLRPNGVGAVTNQVEIDTSGNVLINGTLTVTG